MNSRISTAKRTSLLAAGLVGLAAAAMSPAAAQNAAPAAAPGAPPAGWFKACSKQQDVDICNVQNIMVSENGQLVTGISLIEIKGKVNRRAFQVSVPTGRLVPPGIGMQVDGGQATKLDYMICLPDRCIAEAPLTDDLVNRFKRGSQLTLTSVNFQNQQSPIQLTLQGFTGAYDGPPLNQADIEDRQKQLEEFVSRNNDEFARRLKEEQDKAKAGN
jgi:invasion protein IalB